jgi:hypothetical protein
MGDVEAFDRHQRAWCANGLRAQRLRLLEAARMGRKRALHIGRYGEPARFCAGAMEECADLLMYHIRQLEDGHG